MIVARIVSGIGMGFVNSTVPVIQAEFSPKSSRGRFVCMQLSTLNFGGSHLVIAGFSSDKTDTNKQAS
jgi:MFS family permease